MRKGSIKNLVPSKVMREIEEHLLKKSKVAQTGYKSAPRKEDGITGDLAGCLRTDYGAPIEENGYIWRWRVTHRIFSSGNQYQSEEREIGADILLQIEVTKQKVSITPINGSIAKIDNVEREETFRKAALVQAKRHDNPDHQSLVSQLEKIEVLTPGNGLFLEYAPDGYRVAKASKVIENEGKFEKLSNDDLVGLTDFLVGDFLECKTGVKGMYIDLDAEPQVLLIPNDKQIEKRIFVGKQLLIHVNAYALVDSMKGRSYEG